eukprot:jgi/Psemu1/30152/gm1.30152_g
MQQQIELCDFLDVEFERSEPDQEEDSTQTNASENDLSALLGTSKNLLDVSLDSGDPMWKETRIPFCRGTEYIDCKLTFMVDLEGQSYGIGVPFDDVVAIVIQENTENKKTLSDNPVTKTKNISPDDYEDNEEYAELMEIFAGQVQEQLGEEFQLRKTPKVLTISGGLDKITKDWQNRVITKPFEVEDLLEMSKEKDQDDVDEELDSFYKFMKDELGDEEFEKTMNADNDEAELEAELKKLMEYFNVPGAEGTSVEDAQGLEELMESMANDIETGEVTDAKEFIPDTENAALKLLGYTFRDSGKSYFLVKPLQPCNLRRNLQVTDMHVFDVVLIKPLRHYHCIWLTVSFFFSAILDTLVGRHAKDEEDMIRFDLLTPEEENAIIPKLESLCQEDLKASGLSLTSSNVEGAATA